MTNFIDISMFPIDISSFDVSTYRKKTNKNDDTDMNETKRQIDICEITI